MEREIFERFQQIERQQRQLELKLDYIINGLATAKFMEPPPPMILSKEEGEKFMLRFAKADEVAQELIDVARMNEHFNAEAVENLEKREQAASRVSQTLCSSCGGPVANFECPPGLNLGPVRAICKGCLQKLREE